jgi:hypothetical protein
MTKDDLNYIAGFIDGEGYIGLKLIRLKPSVNYSPEVSVYNTNRQIIEWIGSIIGGGITKKKSYKANCKQGWKLYIQSQQKSLDVCGLLIPYLRIKKNQAILLKKWCEVRIEKRKNSEIVRDNLGKIVSHDRSYDEKEYEIYKKLRALNKRGK